jgi:2-methylcitrate dehydratase PrpD
MPDATPLTTGVPKSRPVNALATTAEETISQRLAVFTHDLRYDDVPETLRERAKHLILDAIGIALAANTFEFAERIFRGISALGGEGRANIIGRAQKLPLRDAVLMNGALIHGLDYDDTHMRAIVHATAGCLPVMLGVGQDVGAHGRDALVAHIAGMESAIRIGAAAKGGFHHAGFHATGVVAHFAAALSAGRLYGLTSEQLAAAQGIAASTASAVQVFLEEGTWSKRLHPGWGGVGGITAARLAQHDFVAPSRPYEGKYGLFDSHLQLHVGEVDYSAITAGLKDEWEMGHTVIKPYPICHFLHAAVEAAIDLHHANSFGPDDIAEVKVLLPKDTIAIVTEPWEKKCRPTSDYEAKFSAQYTAATALLLGRFGLAELQPESLSDEEILSVSQRVAVVVDTDTAFPKYYSGGVEVTLTSGQQLRAYHRVNKGAGERTISNAEIVAKYERTAGLAISRSTAEDIRDHVLEMDRSDLSALWRVLATG